MIDIAKEDWGMMPRIMIGFLMSALIPVSMVGCRKDSSIDASLFAVEVIDGIRHVHNYKAQRGDMPGARLELLAKIGKLEANEERDILYDPVDAARLSNGDILVLERGGATVKRYDKNHEYLSAFGQKGQGPGDFVSPYCLRLNRERDKLYIADSKISVFSLGGRYEGGFKPAIIASFGSIGAEHKTSGMAVLSGSRVILPSHPSVWVDSGEQKLLSVYDETGKVIRSFGAAQFYADPQLTLNANIAHFAPDKNDEIYIAYAYQNRISKYSQDGQLLFLADRPLRYEVKNVTKVEVFKSGEMEKEFSWPSVSAVAKGIFLDGKNRIWVLTFLKQPNRFLTFDEEEDWAACFEFEVFNPDGILLFKVPIPNVRFDGFSAYDDRVYLIDSQHESCIYEYKIVDEDYQNEDKSA
jgi:6-bladed beta-propeller